MIYPITIKRQSGRADSVSGGKDYHLVLITLADGRAMLITRFGKKDTWGTGFNVSTFDRISPALIAYDSKYRAKIGRNYDDILIDTQVSCADSHEFRKALGEQYWAKIGKEKLEWISPNLDTTGVRRSSRDMERDDSAFPPVEPAKVETAEERAKQTPVFGMF